MARSYPRKAEITRTIEAARACGFEVGSIEVSPEGAIRIAAPGSAPASETEFDTWEKAGKL